MSTNPLPFPRTLATVLREIDMHNKARLGTVNRAMFTRPYSVENEMEREDLTHHDLQLTALRLEADRLIEGATGVSFDDIAQRM